MDDPSLVSAKPISPISQLLKNLGMTRDDLTRHSDQMRQFLTAENANSLRAFSNAESDADSAKSPTILPQTLRAKSRSISAADAPPLPSFPPATPIKTEPDEPAASSSVRRFESMDEIIERQNRRSRRERRSRRDRDASPGALPHSPTRPSLRVSGHCRSTSTRDTRDLGRARAVDDSLPANSGLSQVSRAVILTESACNFVPSDIFRRSVQDSLPHSSTPSRAGRYYRDTVLYQTVTPQHRRSVSYFWSLGNRRSLTLLSRARLFLAPSPPLPPGPAGAALPLLYRVRATPLLRPQQRYFGAHYYLLCGVLTSRHISDGILPPSYHTASLLL